MPKLIRILDAIPPFSDLKSSRGVPGQQTLRYMRLYFDKGFRLLTPNELFQIRQLIEIPNATFVEIETEFLYELMRMGFTDAAIEKWWTRSKRQAIGFTKETFIAFYPEAYAKFSSWLERVDYIPPGFKEEVERENDFRLFVPFMERNDLFLAMHCLKTMKETRDECWEYYVRNKIMLDVLNEKDGLLAVYAPGLVACVGSMCAREKIAWAPTTVTIQRTVNQAKRNGDAWYFGKKLLMHEGISHTLIVMRLHVMEAKGVWNTKILKKTD